MRGRTTHKVSSSHRLKKVVLVGWLEQRAGIIRGSSWTWSAAHKLSHQHSWSIGRPDEKGFCRVDNIQLDMLGTEMRASWQFER